jgi:RNA polymerase sigma-70 factor (ECF subfamily)
MYSDSMKNSRIISMRLPRFLSPQHEDAHPRADDNGDSALFRRFFSGDDEAFRTIFKRYHRTIAIYCLKITGSTETAEDLTQDVWERLVALRAGRGIDYRNPAGLLLRIARNLCIDHLKKKRPHESLGELPEIAHPHEHPKELSNLEELVVLSLPKLPFPQREVLVLNTYNGYSYIEIASMLGESVDAVRMRAMRGRYHLGQIIAAMLAAEEDEEGTG